MSLPAARAEPLPESPQCERPKETAVYAEAPHNWRSKNVPRTILFSFCDNASFSIWYSTVLQMLIYELTNDSNAAVGWVSGTSGCAQVMAAGIAGFLADQYPKQLFCWSAGVLGVEAVVFSALGTHTEDMRLIYIAAFWWGAYQGLNNTAVEALFADSVPRGQRTGVYTAKWVAQIASQVVGYALCLGMFIQFGDDWSLDVLKTVMFCGLGVHFFAFFVLFMLKDEFAKRPAGGEPLLHADESTFEHEQQKKIACTASIALVGGSVPNSHRKGPLGGILRTAHIPYIMVLSDIIVCIGSGMTLRFLPLFFINDYGADPVCMNAIMIGISLLTSVLAYVGQYVSKHMLDRVSTIMLLRTLGTVGTFYLSVARGKAAVLPAMLGVFLVRNALMNAIQGLSRSVIMDYAETRHRARWNAMESFTSLTWAGSAALGGFWADASGYRSTFLVTAVMHTIAIVITVPAAILIRRSPPIAA